VQSFSRIYVHDTGEPWRDELERVLRMWIRCMSRFAHDDQLTGKYLPFWYNERTHVSFLAGAAWRSGHGDFAIEEFRLKKRKKGGLRTGRGDLLIKLADTLVCCECKMTRPIVDPAGTNPWRLGRNSLKKARKDLRGVKLRKVKKQERDAKRKEEKQQKGPEA